MPGKPLRRRSASMKQLTKDEVEDLEQPGLTVSTEYSIDSTSPPITSSDSEKDMSFVPTTETSSESNEATDHKGVQDLSPSGQISPTAVVRPGGSTSLAKKRGSTHKVKSSRRASFQLSNTVNNLAKESGVDHLIGIVNQDKSGEKKKGMREQINDLKEEIEKKGLTKYVDTVNGYSMNGEIKMLKKVLSDHVNINVSNVKSSTPLTLVAPTDVNNATSSSALSPVKGGSENMVKTLAELRAAKETIANLERKVFLLNENSALNGELEDQLCDLEEQVLKANQARVDGLEQNTKLKERITELENEVGVVTEEATAAIRELEEVLDEKVANLEEATAINEQNSAIIDQLKEDNDVQKRTLSRLDNEKKTLEEGISFIRDQVDEAKLEKTTLSESLSAAQAREEALHLQVADALKQTDEIQKKLHGLTESYRLLESEKISQNEYVVQLQEENLKLRDEVKEADLTAEVRIAQLESDLAEATASRDQAVADESADRAAIVATFQTQISNLESEHKESLNAMASAGFRSQEKLQEALDRCAALEKEVSKAGAAFEHTQAKNREDMASQLAKIEQLENSLEDISSQRDEALCTVQGLENDLSKIQEASSAHNLNLGKDLYSEEQLKCDVEFLDRGPEIATCYGASDNDQLTNDLRLQLQTVKEDLVEVERLYENLKEQTKTKEVDKEVLVNVEELREELFAANELANKVGPLEARILELEGLLGSESGVSATNSPGKEDMQNDINVLLAKMAAADKEFEEVQNEHEDEVNALQKAVDSMDRVIVKLEEELALSQKSAKKLQQTVTEQNGFLREAAESLDESDRNIAALKKRVEHSEQNVILRSEMEALLFEKNAELVKVSSDNDFNRSRVESLQRKIVKLSMYNNIEKGNSDDAKEVRRLKLLLEELDRNNEFLISVIERESMEKSTLKTMLKAAYSERDRDCKVTEPSSPAVKKNISNRNSANALWGAMNKTPAFVGYDVIFKLDKIVPSMSTPTYEENKKSVVESLSLMNGIGSTLRSAPIDFFTLFKSQHKLDYRITSAVERLIMGWATQKLYAKGKPKGRIVRVDLSSQSLYCLPLNMRDDTSKANPSSGKKKALLLSIIDLVHKDFNSIEKLNTPNYIEHSACLVCIELMNGECLVFQMQTETERNDFYDSLTSILVKYNEDYTSRLIRSMNIDVYRSSPFLQSIIAASSKRGGGYQFEEITGEVQFPDEPLPDDLPGDVTMLSEGVIRDQEGGAIDEPSRIENRKIITKLGSQKGEGTSNWKPLSKIFGSNGRKLSVHDPSSISFSSLPPGTDIRSSDEEEMEDCEALSGRQTEDESVISSQELQVKNISGEYKSSQLSSSYSPTAPQVQPSVPSKTSRFHSENSLSALTKTSSLFSILNKKDFENKDVEINEIGKLYGSEKADDRRLSVNLSNEKGKRKASFSFVSENPFAQESPTSESSNVNEDSTSSRPGPVRRKSSLFARAINESTVATFETKNDDLPATRPRGLSAETIAKASQLSLSLSDDQDIDSSSTGVPMKGTSSTNNVSSAKSKENVSAGKKLHRRKSLADSSPPPSPTSVGAENAKRFGPQSNLVRSGSGGQSVRNRAITEAPTIAYRSTLMTVDSESLEELRKKAQKRESASRELAAQTSMLKKKMSIKKDIAANDN